MGRSYSKIHSMSSLSPKEQIIITPVPNSASTFSSTRMGTWRSKTGTTAVFPSSRAASSTSGLTATVWQVHRSSGRVVAMRNSSPSSVWNAM